VLAVAGADANVAWADLVQVPGTASLNAIACPGRSACLAVGNDEAGRMVVVPISDGVPGAIATGPELFPAGLACVDETTCLAVGGDSAGRGVVVPINGGAPGAVRAIAGGGFLNRVACDPDGVCTAVGLDETFAQGVVVPDAMSAGASAVAVPETGGLNGIACPRLGSCVVVGTDGDFSEALVVNVTGGAPGQPLGTGPSTLTDIACTGPDTCTAVGIGFGLGPFMTAVRIDQGTPGRPHATPEAANDGALAQFPLAVACSTPALCVSTGFVPVYNPGSVAPVVNGKPSILEDVPGTFVLSAVVCARDGPCLAVGTSADQTRGVLLRLAPEGVAADTSLVAAPRTADFGRRVTFTARVSAARGQPRGRVFFSVDGVVMDFPRPLNDRGDAAFTVAGLAPGTHRIKAYYVGSELFPQGISPAFEPGSATVRHKVRCARTLSGRRRGHVEVDDRATCISRARIDGSVEVAHGASLSIDSSTIAGAVDAEEAGALRLCNSTVGGSVTVRRAGGVVLVGDRSPDNNNTGCTANTIRGRLTFANNPSGVKAIGNTVGSIRTVRNSGVGPYPFDRAPTLAPNIVAGTGQSTFLAPSAGASGEPVDGMACGLEQFGTHIHAHLAVFAGGQPLAIPDGVGQAPPLEILSSPLGPFAVSSNCLYPLHTHDQTGTIHVEAPRGASFTLGQFFDVWQQPLGRDRVGPQQGRVTISVDRVRYSGDPRDIPLGDHTLIQFNVGHPVVPPQPFEFTWASR
jgi:hypothetical protein